MQGAEDFRARAPFNQHWRTNLPAANPSSNPIRPQAPRTPLFPRPNTAFADSYTPYHARDPRREVLHMDCSGSNPDYIWSNNQLCRHPSFSATVPRTAIQRTFPARGVNPHLLQPITRLPKITDGKGDLPGYTKLAMYNPDSFERRGASGLAVAAPSTATETRDLLPASTPPVNPRSYEIPIPDYPRASIDGQASLRSWLEKQELMDEPELLGDGTDASEQRVSRAFSARSLFRSLKRRMSR